MRTTSLLFRICNRFQSFFAFLRYFEPEQSSFFMEDPRNSAHGKILFRSPVQNRQVAVDSGQFPFPFPLII